MIRNFMFKPYLETRCYNNLYLFSATWLYDRLPFYTFRGSTCTIQEKHRAYTKTKGTSSGT